MFNYTIHTCIPFLVRSCLYMVKESTDRNFHNHPEFKFVVIKINYKLLKWKRFNLVLEHTHSIFSVELTDLVTSYSSDPHEKQYFEIFFELKSIGPKSKNTFSYSFKNLFFLCWIHLHVSIYLQRSEIWNCWNPLSYTYWIRLYLL